LRPIRIQPRSPIRSGDLRALLLKSEDTRTATRS